MPNPLFNAIMGGSKPVQNQPKQIPASQPGTAQNAPQATQMSFQDAMRQLQSNPAQMIKQAGYEVPEEMANNPQQAVMHLIQSGQVKNPVMQRIQPMLNMLMGGRR